VSGPGDRAPKHSNSREPTPFLEAEGHGGDPKNVDLGRTRSPESKSSARTQRPSGREPGDLDEASLAVVVGRQTRKGKRPKAAEQGVQESDEVMVPEKPAKTRVTPVETVEGRTEAEGKAAARNASPTQGGQDATTRLQRIGQRAKEKPKEKLTNLLSLVKEPLLKEAYERLKKKAVPGVDKVRWADYGRGLDARLQNLQDRIHRGSYHPQPVKRAHIPKGDGRTRPLGIPTLEDKVVQQAVRMVLEPIYEAMFVGFSYGFRPKRSQHDALDAIATAISRKVSFVLDADIRSFFDTIDHGWMQQFLEHRIGDRRMVRLVMKWMRAGVMEEDELHAVEEGTPQGGVISPLLSNIYLHYVLDLWVCQWRKRQARGEVYVVRYADDFVMGFQLEQDAKAMLSAVGERLAKFGLELHPEKSRVLEFGRFARERRERVGESKPETFEFLGFTHIAGRSLRGAFQLKRRTSRKKRRAKLGLLKEEIRKRRHFAVAEQHAWICSVLRGHYRYYAVPTNSRALRTFAAALRTMWHRSLQRRSQRGRWTVAKLRSHEDRFPLQAPKIHHPWPTDRFAAR
jgi:RNA-directed DNA polymerase